MNEPEYERQDFEEVAQALDKVREQYLAGEPLTWTGPDRLHHSIAATSPPPSWYFSPEGMTYMAERDHGFWEVYTMMAFQIGYHNGVMRMDDEVRDLRRLLR